ncbi:Serine-enriched protein [Nymphon striatum]|nr:Serine-enriched protein [Nymphon striatum]
MILDQHFPILIPAPELVAGVELQVANEVEETQNIRRRMAEDSSTEEEEPDYSLFENKHGLSDDMKFLASMPELCDVTFLVGETREPVCAVKAVLAARSRVFFKMLYGLHNHHRGETTHKKRESSKETKLKLFLKRSSEPTLNVSFPTPPIMTHQTIIIEEFEPDVFRQLIEYIHTGCVTLQARTLLGVMNAADYYGLDELRRACMGFVQRCINVDTVCALLASAEKYIQYKCTKSLVQKVLEYVDLHGNEVLSLGSFALLPQHVLPFIGVKDFVKETKLPILEDVMANFLEYIEFYKIPASILMKEVHPLGLGTRQNHHDCSCLSGMFYLADPTSVDFDKLTSPNRFRRARSFSIVSQNIPQLEIEATSSVFSGEWDSRTNSSESSHQSISPRPYRRSDTIK